MRQFLPVSTSEQIARDVCGGDKMFVLVELDAEKFKDALEGSEYVEGILLDMGTPHAMPFVVNAVLNYLDESSI